MGVDIINLVYFQGCQMLNIRLSVLALSIVSFSMALLAGCAGTNTDPTAAWSPEKIYSEARDEVSAGAWDRAALLFDKLEGRAAGTPLAQQAQIEKAYAQFRTGDKVQAIATLDRFLKLHPASPAIDYALYLKGLVNFNDNLGLFSFLTQQDLSERDQKAAKDSFESFKELTQRFPDSKYTPDSLQRMTYIVNSLASYEIHVARYYLSKGAHVAAINRAQLAITDYPGVPATKEALEIMVKSYDAMGLKELKADTQRVLDKNFPANTKIETPKATSWWKFW
jgi:outer membrane protein assembly factor BamD